MRKSSKIEAIKKLHAFVFTSIALKIAPIILLPWIIAGSIGYLSMFVVGLFTYREVLASWAAFFVYMAATVVCVESSLNRLSRYGKHLFQQPWKWGIVGISFMWFFFVYVIFGSMGWFTKCDTCKQNNLWYGTKRISPLYPFRNFGSAYVKKDKGYTIPSGYVSVPAVWGHFVPDRWLKDKTWHTIMPVGMVLWIAGIALVHSVLALAWVNKEKKKQK